MSETATAHSAATTAQDQSGAYAQALFLATFPAGHTPLTDTRTPAQVKASRTRES